MPLLSLNSISLYQTLVERNTSNSIQYSGLLQPIAEDINYLLEYIKNIFPEYPSHDFQHSLRILNYISKLMSDDNVKTLSDSEIFCLIMVAFFHDTSMAMYTVNIEKEQLRDNHHILSVEVLDKYFDDKLQILPVRERIKSAVAFACKSHNMDINELYDSKLYNMKDTINGDTVRYSLLASFIRIGDLLDLDCDRVNEYVMSNFSDTYSDISLAHNKRHLKVEHYYCTQSEINVEVLAEDVEQFKIWSVWFDYIKNEILHINTYLQESGFHLPKPNAKINKAPNASFEVEELRFEIDDSGGIWKILSQSIYTDEFDFVRELLQNAIDATLLPVYLDDTIDIPYASPRSWEVSEKVYIGFSEIKQELYVVDNGIGMDASSLKRFLFKITGSGYSDYVNRPFKFPGISKFGIGFVSCLINASNIDIFTKKYDSEFTYKVSLAANNNLAIMQKMQTQDYCGTVIKLNLKNSCVYDRLLNYIKDFFIYPSVNIIIIDMDKLEKSYNVVMKSTFYEDILNEPFKLIKCYNRYEEERNKRLKPLNKFASILGDVSNKLEVLYEWLDANKNLDNDYSDSDKVKFFRRELKAINKEIEQIDVLPSLNLSYKQVNEKQLFLDTQYYLDAINVYKDTIKRLIEKNNEKRNIIIDYSHEIVRSDVIYDVLWNHCIIFFDSAFNISDIVFDQEVDLSNRFGIVLTHHSMKDLDKGYEYSSINGFLFSNGEVCNSVSKLSGHSIRQITHSKYDSSIFIGGLSNEYNFDDIIERFRDQYDEIDPCWVDNTFSAIVCKNDAFDFFYDVTQDELSVLEHRNNYRDNLCVLIDRYILSTKDESSDVDITNYTHLKGIFESEKSQLCQDGIKLQEQIFNLFPIGYSKVCCNLTASSKMTLNVTRHKISELKSEIMPWIEKTALYIQKSIFQNVCDLLSDLSLQFDYKDLVSDKNSSDFISSQLRYQFMNKVLKP